MEKEKIELKVITPIRTLYTDKVDKITLESATGQLTILPHHAKLFTPTREGELVIVNGEEITYLSVGKGLLEVMDNKINLMLEDAYHADEISEQMAQEAKERAEKILQEKPKSDELTEAKALYRRSLIDLKVARRKKRSNPSNL